MPKSVFDPSDETRDHIAALVRSGRFANADDVLREGLGLLQSRATTSDDEKLKMLRAAVQRGLDDFGSGRFEEFADADTLDAYFRDLTRDIVERENVG